MFPALKHVATTVIRVPTSATSPVCACGNQAIRVSPAVVPADDLIEAGNPGPHIVRSVGNQFPLDSVSLTLGPVAFTIRLISIKQRLQPCPLRLRFPLVHDPGILRSTTSRSSRTSPCEASVTRDLRRRARRGCARSRQSIEVFLVHEFRRSPGPLPAPMLRLPRKSGAG